MNEDLKQLRKKIDGDDPFMSHGYEIKKIRTREKVAPVWVTSDVKLRKLLNEVFPKWRTEATQRKRAARWAAIITLFYRMGMSKAQVAAELKTTPTVINRVLQTIRARGEGRVLKANQRRFKK